MWLVRMDKHNIIIYDEENNHCGNTIILYKVDREKQSCYIK